jgi:penicillin-binding protein A
MKASLRAVALIAAVVLLGYGMLQPVDRSGDLRWLLCLWGAAPLLLFAAFLSSPSLPPGLARSVRNLGLVLGVGFVMLSLELLREQVVRADAIYYKVVTNEATGEVTSNVRPVLQSMRVQRGKIFDRNGELLVDSRVGAGGFVHRVYPLAERYDPAAFSNIVGFHSTRFGQAGLEATYGDYLSGEKGGRPLERLNNSIYGRPQVGNDLRLTLNAPLQSEVAALMGGRRGSVVVLDPTSGAVLAMVSTPGYDPQHLAFNPDAADWNSENEAARIGVRSPPTTRASRC